LKRHITYCKANNCTWAAEPNRLMCRHHWRLLPGHLQANVISAFKANSSAASRLANVDYLEAAAAAVEYIAEKEGHPRRNAFRDLAARVKNQEIKTCL
jgi:hypothetical protein